MIRPSVLKGRGVIQSGAASLFFFVLVPVAWFAWEPLLAGGCTLLLMGIIALVLRVSPMAVCLDLLVAICGAATVGALVQIFLYPSQFPVAAVWLLGVLWGWRTLQSGAMGEKAARSEEAGSPERSPAEPSSPGDQQITSSGTL